MSRKQEKKRNLIILIVFAAIFSSILGFSLVVGETTEVVSAAEFTDLNSLQMAEGDQENVIFFESDEAAIDWSEFFAEADEELEDEDLEAMEETTGTPVIDYTVTKYDSEVTMYSSDTVNVRVGAGTDFERIGRVTWGTPVTVTGVTDNGWYEVFYKDTTAYIMGDYIVSEMPGIPYLFVGDSRTVQMQLAVGSTDKAYVAKVGEGYNYFKNVAISSIQQYAGRGTVMIINFGVNDLSNASKYIKLVNSNIDSWVNAGVTVYYSAVTPVGSGASVSNEQIEAFNAKLQEGLDPRVNWIDSYSYLMQTGFSSSDGLHYDKSTYKNLYSYYMAVISQQQ